MTPLHLSPPRPSSIFLFVFQYPHVVATIVDIESLRAGNEFYAQADNGDHLVITRNRAILYDPDRNIIVDVVPVSIDQEEQNKQSSPSPSPTP